MPNKAYPTATPTDALIANCPKSTFIFDTELIPKATFILNHWEFSELFS